MVLISLVQWIIDGRRNYTGPKVDIDVTMLTAEQSAEIDPEIREHQQADPDSDGLEKDKAV